MYKGHLSQVGETAKENDIYGNIYVYVLKVYIYMSETTKNL